VEERLQSAAFVECGSSQSESAGWVPPRGERHGALLESVGGQWMLRRWS
jgi:recombination associated protein RdgC